MRKIERYQDSGAKCKMEGYPNKMKEKAKSETRKRAKTESEWVFVV